MYTHKFVLRQSKCSSIGRGLINVKLVLSAACLCFCDFLDASMWH